MKALITGANGQLGRALQKLLPDAIVTDRDELDITDSTSVEAFDFASIEIIFNAAAYNAVDKAEQDQILAWNINATAVANLAKAAKEHDIPLVHLSTDYVFDGMASKPYSEDASFNPQGAYAISKASGELAARLAPKHYVVRTSWVYGDGNNFVRTMVRLGRERSELSVVSDQLGRPTSAHDLAAALVHLVGHQAAYGTYHFQNSGEVISWAEFATAIFDVAQIDCKVTPVTTAEYTKDKPAIAPRPAYGALALDKITAAGIAVPPWQSALKEYLALEPTAG